MWRVTGHDGFNDLVIFEFMSHAEAKSLALELQRLGYKTQITTPGLSLSQSLDTPTVWDHLDRGWI